MIVLLISIAILFLMGDLLDWSVKSAYTNNKIKFKSFQSFYNVNPDRWELKEGYVKCVEQRDSAYWRLNTKSYIDFNFSYIDFHKYRKFYKRIEKYKDIMKINNEYSKMIELVKSDIAAMEKKSNEDMVKASQDIRTIVSRM